jgi:hypothetical protein
MAQADIARAIADTLISPNETDANLEAANVVDGLFAIARSLSAAANHLGTGNAATNMGAIEAHAKAILETGQDISGGLQTIAEHIGYLSDSVEHLAEAIRTHRNQS